MKNLWMDPYETPTQIKHIDIAIKNISMKLTGTCEASSRMGFQTKLYVQGNYTMLLLASYTDWLKFQNKHYL